MEGNATVNAMLRAAETGDLAAVKASIANGVDIMAKDGAKNTAIHLAAYRGYPDVVRLMIENNADPTVGNENNDLPSHLAALANHISCLQVS